MKLERMTKEGEHGHVMDGGNTCPYCRKEMEVDFDLFERRGNAIVLANSCEHCGRQWETTFRATAAREVDECCELCNLPIVVGQDYEFDILEYGLAHAICLARAPVVEVD